MAGSTLREISLPRYTMRADEAAASCGVSLSLFKRWEKEGKMPKGRKVDGVVLYSCERVREHALRLVEDAVEDDVGDDWGDDPA